MALRLNSKESQRTLVVGVCQLLQIMNVLRFGEILIVNILYQVWEGLKETILKIVNYPLPKGIGVLRLTYKTNLIYAT